MGIDGVLSTQVDSSEHILYCPSDIHSSDHDGGAASFVGRLPGVFHFLDAPVTYMCVLCGLTDCSGLHHWDAKRLATPLDSRGDVSHAGHWGQ